MGCDSAHLSTLHPRCVPSAQHCSEAPALLGLGAIPGPADAGFDPEELSPRFFPPCHQLLPTNYSGGCSPAGLAARATRLPCGWEQRSLPSKDPRASVTQAAGCMDSHGDIYLGKSRGARISTGLNQLWKGPSAALPFLHFFVHRVHLRGSPEHLVLQPVSMVTRHQHLGTGRQLFAVAALVDGDEPPQSGCEGR